MTYIYCSEMSSPIGDLTIGRSEKGICFLEFGTIANTGSAIVNRYKKKFLKVDLIEEPSELQEAKEQLEQYFCGERNDFDLPLDLIGTRFQILVWNRVASIPYGVTKSYKDIATEVGAPKAVRAIGGANNRNPVPIIIPCHRVIGTNGSLVGYGGGLDKKTHLLRHEGAIGKIS